MNSFDPSEIHVAWVDLDDTLIDFKANSKAALANLYESRNLRRFWATPEEWIEAYEGHNIPLWVDYSVGIISCDILRMERFRRPLVDAGMPDAEARELSPALDPEYLDFLAMEKRLIPGALELLEVLRRSGMTIGVLSNGFADVQHRKIARAGLADKIDLTVLSDDIGVNKPDIRLFRHAQSLTSYPDTPSAHLMIGDNPATDIGGALGARWHAVWYNPRGYTEIPHGAISISSLSEATSLFSR